MTPPSIEQINLQVQQALDEDIAGGDVTAELISATKEAHAQLICRENAILCGRDWFDSAFALLDNKIKINCSWWRGS